MGKVEIGKRRVWQRRTYIWVLSGLIAISALIYWEQTALLFVLSTLGMCVLLVIVAVADLEGRDKELHQRSDSLKPETETLVPDLASSPARKKQKGAA